MNEEVRVLLFCGNEAGREELVRMLSNREGIVVIGTAQSGEEVLTEAEKLSPGVVLMVADSRTMGMKAMETTCAINKARLPAKVIIITENISRDLAPAVKAGAAGLLSRNISRDELLSAISKIHLWVPVPSSSGNNPIGPGCHIF